MEEAHRVTDQVYFLRHPVREGWFTGVTVILGTNDVGVVDSGLEDTPEKLIFPFLHERGRPESQIVRVVNTHRDGDHMLGNAAIKERTGAEICAHEADADDILHVRRRLQDGEVVRLGDWDFTVIHSPGHTPGNCVLYQPTWRMLITGDTLVGQRTELVRLGKEPYVASIRRIMELPIERCVMAHPFPPAGKNVLDGEETRSMMAACIEIAEDL
jgi:hydroxyacylglutathione hydrolase